MLSSHLQLSSLLTDLPVDTLSEVKPMPGDGSERKFFRVRFSERSFVLVLNPPNSETARRENRAFSVFGRYLRSLGLPVPEIYAEDDSTGRFLVQDVGNLHVQDFSKKYQGKPRKILYRKIIRLLHEFHSKAPASFDPTYCLDGAYYDYCFVIEKELEYFRKSFLNDFLGLRVRWDQLSDDFSYLAERAGITSPDGVIHRDFQSRNLMVHKGKIYMLDFQGMRYGPPEYDVASLYLDPYVHAKRTERLSWVRYYESLNPLFSRERFQAVELCRNLQILAAFAFLSKKRGKLRFAAYIPKTWNWLRQNRLLRNCPKLSRLRNILDLAEPGIQKVVDSFAITCYRRTLHQG